MSEINFSDLAPSATQVQTVRW